MTRFERIFLMAVASAQTVLAVCFFLQWPVVTNLWPFPGTTPLTFMFLSSVFAAAAASTFWSVGPGHHGALAGIGLDYLTILAPVAILAFRLGATGDYPRMTAYGWICVAGAVFGLALFLRTVGIPMDRTVPMPRLVRWSFVLFVGALLIVGGRLVLEVPYSIPWMVTTEMSVVMGWMFLGAAVYFAYGLLRPSWVNSAGQLIGFLAYDVVLIVPFLKRLPVTLPYQRTAMIIYTIVVIYSGLMAIYFLFLNPSTRLWKEKTPMAVPTS